MGMFGKRTEAYATTGLKRPGLGGQILNQVGMNLLGVDFEGQRLQQALAEKRQAFLDDFQSRLGPQYEDGPAPQVGVRTATTPGLFGSQATTRELAPAPDYQYQAPQRTSDGLGINSPELAGLSLRGARLGANISPALEVLKAQQPAWQAGPDGNWNNTHGSVAPRPSAVNGIVRNGDGTASAVPNFAEAQAGIEGAKTAAQEQAKAHEDLVDYVISGVPYKLPRDVATALSRAQFSGGAQPPPPAPGGGPASRPAAAGGFGRGLSPGEVKAQEIDFGDGAKLMGDAQEAAITAQSNARNARTGFDQVLQLDPNNLTGFKLGAAKLIRSLYPQSPDLENFVGTAEGYRQLTTRMVLPKAKELGSNPSNRDAKIITESMPNLSTPRQAGAVYFAMESASATKEAQRQEFFQNWQGEPRKSAMQRAWSETPEAKRSIFQDPTFARLQLNGHPAVVQVERNGTKYGIYMPYLPNGKVNPNAQTFRVY